MEGSILWNAMMVIMLMVMDAQNLAELKRDINVWVDHPSPMITASFIGPQQLELMSLGRCATLLQL